jgi:hypothetical protein
MDRQGVPAPGCILAKLVVVMHGSHYRSRWVEIECHPGDSDTVLAERARVRHRMTFGCRDEIIKVDGTQPP